MIPAKYYLKNILYGLTPGGFGYMRTLKSYRKTDYDHERDKHPVRERHNGSEGWKNEEEAEVQHRNYADYNEYLTHQKQKLNEILSMRGGFTNRAIMTWRRRFYQRFRHLEALLPKTATILCLGARQGTEVEVLHDMGYTNAYGIDLNPGPNNPYVKEGDFMHLEEKDNSIDCIYTNSLDHAFDIEPCIKENLRVVKPEGIAIYDVPRYSKSRSPGAFEAVNWKSEQMVFDMISRHFHATPLTMTEKKWQWMLCQGPKKSP